MWLCACNVFLPQNFPPFSFGVAFSIVNVLPRLINQFQSCIIYELASRTPRNVPLSPTFYLIGSLDDIPAKFVNLSTSPCRNSWSLERHGNDGKMTCTYFTVPERNSAKEHASGTRGPDHNIGYAQQCTTQKNKILEYPLVKRKPNDFERLVLRD